MFDDFYAACEQWKAYFKGAGIDCDVEATNTDYSDRAYLFIFPFIDACAVLIDYNENKQYICTHGDVRTWMNESEHKQRTQQVILLNGLPEARPYPCLAYYGGSGGEVIDEALSAYDGAEGYADVILAEYENEHRFYAFAGCEGIHLGTPLSEFPKDTGRKVAAGLSAVNDLIRPDDILLEVPRIKPKLPTRTRTPKPIETHYNGYRFRSRLEARWAVFFDALGIKYEYELEGFDLGDLGWYLPDFYLSDLDYWVEVKPTMPHLEIVDGKTLGEDPIYEKLYRLADSGRYFLLVWGAPSFSNYSDKYHVYGDWGHNFVVCEKCGRVWVQWVGKSHVECSSCGAPTPTESQKLANAITAARSARFEHGEREKMALVV
jgi:hypothetical protein